MEPVSLLLCPPDSDSDSDLVMHTMAMEMLKRIIINSKIATKQRTTRVRRHEPKSAGGTAEEAGVDRVRPVVKSASLVRLSCYCERVELGLKLNMQSEPGFANLIYSFLLKIKI